MSKFFGERWSNLAKSLTSPNSPSGSNGSTTEDVEWPEWGLEREEYMRLEIPGLGVVSGGLRKDLCETLWDTLPP